MIKLKMENLDTQEVIDITINNETPGIVLTTNTNPDGSKSSSLTGIMNNMEGMAYIDHIIHTINPQTDEEKKMVLSMISDMIYEREEE